MTAEFVNFFCIQWYIGGTEIKKQMNGVLTLIDNDYRVPQETAIHS